MARWQTVLRDGPKGGVLLSEIFKRAPVPDIHGWFLDLEFREDSVPFCIIAALAA
jgi:hypothetical protein